MNLEKFKNIPFKKRTTCIVCDCVLDKPLINLPGFPLTEIYVDIPVTEKIGFVDQEFHFCKNCEHGQIGNVIAPEFLYGNNYVTRTSTSSSAVKSIDVFLVFVNKILNNKPAKSVLDIGCNDVYTLKKLKNNAEKLYGVDPILKGKEEQFNDDQITVFGDFFENIDFQSKKINFDVVLCSHTLEHVEHPKELISNLLKNSGEETLFFFQFPGLEPLVENAHFDQVFHQHLNYFSLKSILYLLNSVGAELVNFEFNNHHWGTLMICFKKKKEGVISSNKFETDITSITEKEILAQYKLFKDSMALANERLASFNSETVYGYGAALMVPVLNYYIHNFLSLKNIIDDDKNKDGLYYINTPIQIIHSEKIGEIKNSIIFITATTSKQAIRDIVKKLIDLNVKEIIIPVNLI